MNIFRRPSHKPDVKPSAMVANKGGVFVRNRLVWGLLVGALLAAAVIVLAAQDVSSTTIAFLSWEFSTSLIVMILGTLVVGAAADEQLGLVYRARRRRALGDRDQLERFERSAANPQVAK